MDSAYSLDHITRLTAQTDSFKDVIARLGNGQEQILLHGLPSTLAAFLANQVRSALERPVLIVAFSEDRAEEWRDDLQAIAGEEIVCYFPAWDTELYDRQSPDDEITGLRIEAASRLMRDKATIVVAPASALLMPLIPPHALELGSLELKVGEECDLDALCSHLVDCGFERVAAIDGIGQFSLRGGILDIFPFGVEHPYRCEFFDDEIESIRHFDVNSQRSLSTCEEAWVMPAREVLLGSPFYEDYLQRIDDADAGQALAPLKDQLELGESLEGIESFAAVLYGRDNGLFEYLKEPLIFLDEGEEIAEELDKTLARPRKEYQRHQERGIYLAPTELLRDEARLETQLSNHTRLEPAPLGRIEEAVRFGASEPQVFEGELSLLRQAIDRLVDESYTIHIRSETKGQSERLQEIFSEWPETHFGLGSLHRGFTFPQAQLALLNDHEIFSRQRRRYRYRKFRSSAAISNYGTLQRGDLVVHINHGIGRYSGIRRLRIDNRERDCLTVTYQGKDRLFIPIEQLDRLRKYSNSEGEAPILSKLGGTAWEKLKERTREEIFKMASELMQLYAERKARPGFRFSADNPMYRELEAAFPFQETPDQLRTMEEVKADMESPHPMDRLVCGDVGYGKTEIAVRASFKTVCDQKQVAVLVPTTILAEQHYLTFSERMDHTPARVEVLSRFRTPKEQKQILEDVKNGKVDILIGTHRILSKDIRFRDLGLLVVDEEQRFGVRHKERLKQFKRLVDVLTLTATPIPRTLHLSMMSARDMSVINTPPQDRLPIHTEILAFDETRIAEAIHREVEREGQVYFVHNRVQSIHRLSEYLQDLLPQVRFGVAHGQMPPRQLEKIMFDFMERKYDCLVCTMIIESGIDIPSVNTILVNRADTLGLSQLYQIRGRVGRSNERAYAYLLVPKGKKLTKKSRMRLRAIEEFADLGSGFNISMRDLEIRGAGNLVGAQQHGFITAVGFDLYCRLLDEAIRELKGEAVADSPEPEIQITISAYIPDEYLPDPDHKMEFYQRLADAARIVDLLDIREEMVDRFGRLPQPARSLMHIMEIKIMARQLGLENVQLEKNHLRLSFPENRQISPVDIQRMVEKCSTQLNFDLDAQLKIAIQMQGRDEIERLEKTRDILEEIL